MGAPDRDVDDNRPARTGYQGPRPAGGGAPGNFTPGAAPGGSLPDRDGQSKKNATRPPAVPSIFRTPRTTGAAAAMIWMMCRAEVTQTAQGQPCCSQATQPLKAVKRKIRIEEAVGWPTWLTRWA